MKILEITTVHPSDDTRIYQKYVKSLLEANFEVGYIAPDPSIIEAPGLTILAVKRRGRLWSRLFGLLKKIPEIREFNPDYIHLHDPEHLLIVPFLRFFGFKIIYDMHENFYRELDDKPISWISNRLQKLTWIAIEKLILKKMPVVFAEASYKKHYAFQSDMLIVQNFPMKNNIIHTQKRSVGYKLKPKFVYLGAIASDRGALKMVSSLNDTFGHNNYELHFIGQIKDLKLENQLKKIFLKHPNVIYHGWKALPEARKICVQCDVGLAILDPKQNYIESYPTKIFEYLTFGLPVISSNFDLYRGVVENHNVGLCVDPDNNEDISRALKTIVEESKYSELSSSIESFPFDDYSWEFEFEKFVAFLGKI